MVKPDLGINRRSQYCCLGSSTEICIVGIAAKLRFPPQLKQIEPFGIKTPNLTIASSAIMTLAKSDLRQRRGRDSNPRNFWFTRFQVERNRPLCHLSRSTIDIISKIPNNSISKIAATKSTKLHLDTF
jgi:hypothetical protein